LDDERAIEAAGVEEQLCLGRQAVVEDELEPEDRADRWKFTEATARDVV
jgi:hypothetical protein